MEDHNASDFLARRPEGGLHHVCFAVPDLAVACETLVGQGCRLLGSAGASGGVGWLDPAGADGVLIELKQAVAV